MACAADKSQAAVVVTSTWQARVIDDPASKSDARDDNNGGSSVSNLIGSNTGGVDNYLIYSFDVSTLTEAGPATVSFDVNDLNNAQGGDSNDSIELYMISPNNTGLIKGTSEITGSDNPANDGSVTFANKNQYTTGGTSQPWLKADGSTATNLGDALILVSSIAAYDGPRTGVGTDPTPFVFNIDQATVQGWIDNGLTALVLGATDGGTTGTTDGKARFLFSGSATGGAIRVVPEPSSLAMLVLAGVYTIRRRR